MRYIKKTLIEKLKLIHNNKYDYSLVLFNTVKDKIKIICPIHGPFEQVVMRHLNKRGCIKCGYISNKLTTESFIYRCSLKHNNFYDYSLVEYKHSKLKVKIICPEHGIFEQQPSSHLNGQTCKKCILDKDRISLGDFITRSNIKHNNKYDYSLIKTINGVNSKVKIICPEHGIFEQIVSNHLNGNNCRKCSNILRCRVDFIDKSIIKHNNKYDYSLVKYVNNNTNVKIICPEHGIFEQIPKLHLHRGNGCPFCSGKRMNTEFFIKKNMLTHNNKYDYSLVEYKSAFEEVIIICPKHSEFKQKAYIHSNGSGCPICKSSKSEKEIISILEELKVEYIHQKSFDDCKYINKLIYDFYIPKFNMCIEYNGIQHYKSVKFFGGDDGLKITKKRDNIKKQYCKNNNINYKIISYKDNIKNKIIKIINE